MKAIVVREFGPPGVMVLEDVEPPEPGPGQVVVRTHAVGVNPVETYIRSGIYAAKPELPYTPGNDAAGVVESAGESVSTVSVGDRVYTAGTLSGAYAELILCQSTTVYPLPDDLTFKQGAAINIPFATAYRALHHRGGAQPGETLLVHGASGGVGSAAVQLGLSHGMSVIGTAGTKRGEWLLKELGAHHVLNHHTDRYLQELMDLTGGKGVDVILEMLSNVYLANDLGVLATGGRIVVIGCRGTVEINPRDAMARDADIRGMILMNATPQKMGSIHAALGAGLRNRTLQPVVGEQLPLGSAPKAHEAVLEPGAYGKIVLLP